MLYAYSNNGLSYRTVEDGWELSEGEVLFYHKATDTDLSSVFSGYAKARSNADIKAQIAALEQSVPSLSDRTMRELVSLTSSHGMNAKAKSLETQIAALRAQIK